MPSANTWFPLTMCFDVAEASLERSRQTPSNDVAVFLMNMPADWRCPDIGKQVWDDRKFFVCPAGYTQEGGHFYNWREEEEEEEEGEEGEEEEGGRRERESEREKDSGRVRVRAYLTYNHRGSRSQEYL